MTAFTGALIGLAFGACFAAVLNLDLVGALFHVRRLDAGRGLKVAGAVSDRETVMRWIARALLIVLPLAFALIGFAAADDLLGGTP